MNKELEEGKKKIAELEKNAQDSEDSEKLK